MLIFDFILQGVFSGSLLFFMTYFNVTFKSSLVSNIKCIENGFRYKKKGSAITSSPEINTRINISLYVIKLSQGSTNLQYRGKEKNEFGA